MPVVPLMAVGLTAALVSNFILTKTLYHVTKHVEIQNQTQEVQLDGMQMALSTLRRQRARIELLERQIVFERAPTLTCQHTSDETCSSCHYCIEAPRGVVLRGYTSPWLIAHRSADAESREIVAPSGGAIL